MKSLAAAPSTSNRQNTIWGTALNKFRDYGFVHLTWKRPGFRSLDDLEKVDRRQYLRRIQEEFRKIPESVLEQWLYLHH